MNAELVHELKARTARRSARARALSTIGPLTTLAGLIWAFAQPYRITLLHPHGQGFWWLVIEPPLLVMLVGLFFALGIVPGLLEDLEEAEAEET
jgi:hypothetical protein